MTEHSLGFHLLTFGDFSLRVLSLSGSMRVRAHCDDKLLKKNFSQSIRINQCVSEQSTEQKLRLFWGMEITTFSVGSLKVKWTQIHLFLYLFRILFLSLARSLKLRLIYGDLHKPLCQKTLILFSQIIWNQEMMHICQWICYCSGEF